MRIQHLATIALTLLLTACGFHLRGMGSFDFALQELQFKSADSRAPLAKALESRLEAQGVELNATAPFTLYLEHEQHTQRVVSYTAGTRSAEHMLTSSVDYAIRAGDLPDLMTGTAEVQRVLSFNQNHVSASNEEASLLRNEMRNELVMQLMMRLQAIKPEQLEALRATAQARVDADAEAKQQELDRLQQELNLEPLAN